MSQDLISFMLTSRDGEEIIHSEECVYKWEQQHSKILSTDYWWWASAWSKPWRNLYSI